jgi:hypothetical protein
LNDDFWPVEMRLNEIEKVDLIKPFGVDEIKGVVIDMKVNSAPGPNGFTVVFFQKF